jgi:hypothetical protein
MCRSIHNLFNFDPPATPEEVRAAALQFVRKVSGFVRPSQTNQPAFDEAVEVISKQCAQLLASLVTNAPARNREFEAAKARERSLLRFPVRHPQTRQDFS